MTALKALELTETTWVLSKRSGRNGLMRKENHQYIVISGDYAGTYNTIAEIEKEHDVKFTFDTLVDNNVEKTTIEGYPVKHSEVFDIQSGTIPSYTKRDGSKDRFAAGYYAIQFSKACHTSFCPRASTLEAQTYQGPYKTKMESDHAVKLMSEK